MQCHGLVPAARGGKKVPLAASADAACAELPGDSGWGWSWWGMVAAGAGVCGLAVAQFRFSGRHFWGAKFKSEEGEDVIPAEKELI
mmetsp:Transcript_36299/g.77318  ORF Transcript_36299/g.77318 Transcript_36299/m.77318 type:complete len:86 (+) Transcript_36299:258-515(+)